MSSCPACRNSVVWVPAYGQWWCYACQRYYPNAMNDVDSLLNSLDSSLSTPPPACGRCGVLLQFVPQYQRWYCPRCQQYI